MSQNRYPKIYIRSKNDLAKRIASKNLNFVEALALINRVRQNKDKLWQDNMKMSEPKEGKFVRDASRTELGKLLKLIDKSLLAPHDNKLPKFIWGGISGRSNVLAVRELLPLKNRSLLKMDLKGFFEQITRERVKSFFMYKAQCSEKSANFLADLVCVSEGAKLQPTGELVLARGFATSSRLAVWCCLDFFLRLNWQVQDKLAQFNPRIVIFVDDIGIGVSGMKHPQLLNKTAVETERLAEKGVSGQSLKFNEKKTKIYSYLYKTPMDYLGARLHKKTLGLAGKSRQRINVLSREIKDSSISKKGRKALKKRRASVFGYLKYVRRTVSDTSRHGN